MFSPIFSTLDSLASADLALHNLATIAADSFLLRFALLSVDQLARKNLNGRLTDENAYSIKN